MVHNCTIFPKSPHKPTSFLSFLPSFFFFFWWTCGLYTLCGLMVNPYFLCGPANPPQAHMLMYYTVIYNNKIHLLIKTMHYAHQNIKVRNICFEIKKEGNVCSHHPQISRISHLGKWRIFFLSQKETEFQVGENWEHLKSGQL